MKTTPIAHTAAAIHGHSSASGARTAPSVKVGSRYVSGDGPCIAAMRFARPCGELKSIDRCGDTTPARAMPRLTVSSSADSDRAATDRAPWNAMAIIGASSGTIGTRKRAGALDPPHHMYIRVELATKATTVAINASPN